MGLNGLQDILSTVKKAIHSTAPFVLQHSRAHLHAKQLGVFSAATDTCPNVDTELQTGNTEKDKPPLTGGSTLGLWAGPRTRPSYLKRFKRMCSSTLRFYFLSFKQNKRLRAKKTLILKPLKLSELPFHLRSPKATADTPRGGGPPLDHPGGQDVPAQAGSGRGGLQGPL